MAVSMLDLRSSSWKKTAFAQAQREEEHAAELERKVKEKLARADIIEAQRQSIEREMQRARKDIATQEAWLKARTAVSLQSIYLFRPLNSHPLVSTTCVIVTDFPQTYGLAAVKNIPLPSLSHSVGQTIEHVEKFAVCCTISRRVFLYSTQLRRTADICKQGICSYMLNRSLELQAGLERMQQTGRLEMSPELAELERDGLLKASSFDSTRLLLQFPSPLSLGAHR